MKIVDAFAGMGGFSFALGSRYKTGLYCEISEKCHLVLNCLMRDRKIDRAPIYPDITTLQAPHNIVNDIASGFFAISRYIYYIGMPTVCMTPHTFFFVEYKKFLKAVDHKMSQTVCHCVTLTFFSKRKVHFPNK